MPSNSTICGAMTAKPRRAKKGRAVMLASVKMRAWSRRALDSTAFQQGRCDATSLESSVHEHHVEMAIRLEIRETGGHAVHLGDPCGAAQPPGLPLVTIDRDQAAI